MKIYLILFILFPVLCFSQRQQNIWYFGNHAGLDFNSGSPIAITNGQTYLQNVHSEGTSTISDSSGALLFYSNGEKIWNRNHQIMINGDSILSSWSSTQSSLIIPQPGNNNLFYLFTTDGFYLNNLQYGLRYSIIDMCLDNNLGAVISGEKNILLLNSVAEKLTAVKHKNGIDYWVIVHKYFSDAFYAYRLTSDGIMDTVVTQIGSIHNADSQNPTKGAIGYMKASPNGKKLALITLNRADNIKELFDFNDSTGVVSNFIDLELQVDNWGGYGLSFSPDNSKLYYSTTINVYQYDLNSGNGNADSIRESKTQISFLFNDNAQALQIAPDGKIYVAREDKPFLAVINNPNQKGLSCSFQDNAVSLNNKMCSMGLPNLIDSYSYSNSISNCASGIYENIIPNNFSIYPNPFSAETTLRTGNLLKNATLTIYNSFGQTVKQVKNISGQTITLHRDNLSSGLYFIYLMQDSKPIGTNKLIIVQ